MRLLLPAVVPSWRFFDAVTASPRIDYVLAASPGGASGDWHEFDPRVPVLSARMMLRRLVWNPAWNEALYLVSLAERLMSNADPATLAHSEREMLRRVAHQLHRKGYDRGGDWLRIRLRFVHRPPGTDEVLGEVVYVSDHHRLSTLL
ncbi:hypothetical protein [Sphingomonas jinjuensis]|uniref:hypothetical protein n=1 Tax=Sphingomonas jinjuensis TaxID=535907 RepID=UPI001C845190|nr:hypothetical protein [Sphingomonas jinjuensis]